MIPSNSYIVELERGAIEAIAQGIHILSAHDPEDKKALEALESLMRETNIVFRNDFKHKVYPSAVTAPSNSEEVSVHIVPLR